MDYPDPFVEDHDDYDGHNNGTLDAVTLQQMLLATETVEAFLKLLTERVARATRHHCGITVGQPEIDKSAYTVASSNELSRVLDELQYAGGDGPCLHALRSGEPVIVTDMATDSRWSDYFEHARSLGARSSLSYPLDNDGRTIGAINLYAEEPLEPSEELQRQVTELAALTTGALALALRLASRSEMIEHLRSALASRSIIDQAMGIIMAQQRSSAREAFELLRRVSQNRNTKLRDVAANIVGSIERDAPGASRRRY